MAIDLSFFRSETSNLLREQGAVREVAKDILLVLESRGVEIPDDVPTRVRACTDLEELRVWLRKAATANCVDDVFVSDGC
ncbi:hypothetical protein [Nocardia sp. XZ_19_385]|uniref:hypothetical protein n=1 Tax=Nocardia sp. XZ_19_385 TaxID=2769488 RepID=UPI00189065CA|nr:hypothetical protein [Nocardia sp. XZ_19_385]